MQPELLSPDEATCYLYHKFNTRYSVRYLAKLRSTTTAGPTFVNLGRRIYYRPDDLDRWILSRLKRYQTTAERKAAEAAAKQSGTTPASATKAPSPVRRPPCSRDLDIFELLAGRPG